MGPLSETQSRAGGHRNRATIVRSLSAAIGMSAVIAAGKTRVRLPCCSRLAAYLRSIPSASRPRGWNDLLRSLRWLTKLRLLGGAVAVRYGHPHPPGSGCERGKRTGDTGPKSRLHLTNSNQPLYSTPQPSYPGNGPCRFPDVVAGAVARGRSREDPAPGETRAHHRDVAAPGLAAGERKPEAVQGPRPRTSGPLTSGSEAGVQAPEAGLRGRGCKCPPAVESPGACDSGICFPAPEQPRREGEGTKEKLRVAALPLTFRPRPDAIPECGDRESPRPSAAGSPADRQVRAEPRREGWGRGGVLDGGRVASGFSRHQLAPGHLHTPGSSQVRPWVPAVPLTGSRVKRAAPARLSRLWVGRGGGVRVFLDPVRGGRLPLPSSLRPPLPLSRCEREGREEVATVPRRGSLTPVQGGALPETSQA